MIIRLLKSLIICDENEGRMLSVKCVMGKITGTKKSGRDSSKKKLLPCQEAAYKYNIKGFWTFS